MNADDGIAAQAGDGACGTARMTKPDGAMEAALVVRITAEFGFSAVIDLKFDTA